MKTYTSTRNQFVNGEAVALNDTVQADPEKVAYLIARGFLVETQPKPKANRKRQNKAPEALSTKALSTETLSTKAPSIKSQPDEQTPQEHTE